MRHDHANERPTRGPRRADRPRGNHTLTVHEGVVVGGYGDDVFVDLGPRRQGVISRRALPRAPRVGDRYRFTLRGREEDLWALSLAEDEVLEAWEELEAGSLVSARVLRAVPEGLQLKIGPLHAFMPRSQTGLPKGNDPKELVGSSMSVEVLEVDEDKQRAIVSRKAVLKREREGRGSVGVVPGQVVHGRVSRVEDYGVFVRFGHGREGLAHVSNLSDDRTGHPSELFAVGDPIEVKVLFVRQGGRRIGLGVKQLHEPPWRAAERELFEGQVREVLVTRVADFGAFVRILPGVEGLVPASECGGRDPRRDLAPGTVLPARILSLDFESERAALSLTEETGAPLALPDAEARASYDERKPELDESGATTSLGALLRRALGESA